MLLCQFRYPVLYLTFSFKGKCNLYSNMIKTFWYFLITDTVECIHFFRNMTRLDICVGVT